MKYWDEKNKRLMSQEEKDVVKENTDAVKESHGEEDDVPLMGVGEPYGEKKPVKKSRK